MYMYSQHDKFVHILAIANNKEKNDMNICEQLQDVRRREDNRTTAVNTIRHGQGRSKILM
jgi:hypothetical protein